MITAKKESFGLPESVIHSLSGIFELTREVDEVVIFGSRAKGNYSEGSDIDLAIKGKSVSLETILTLMRKAEDLGLLCKMDFINHKTITDSDVLEHIHRVGKVFWKHDPNYTVKITDSLSLT